jgi:hypothetical protein
MLQKNVLYPEVFPRNEQSKQSSRVHFKIINAETIPVESIPGIRRDEGETWRGESKYMFTTL